MMKIVLLLVLFGFTSSKLPHNRTYCMYDPLPPNGTNEPTPCVNYLNTVCLDEVQTNIKATQLHLVERTEESEKKLNESHVKLEDLEAKFINVLKDVNANIGRLKNQTEQQIAEIGRLNNENAELKADFQRLNSTGRKLTDELTEQRAGTDRLKKENQDMQMRLNATEEEIKEMKESGAGPRVAFSTSLVNADEVYEGPSTEKTLVFKQVFSNTYNGYDQNTGIFTAPLKGLYYFTFSTYGYNTHLVGPILLKNDIRHVSTYEHRTDDGSDSSSNAVIQPLVDGDKVHMELWENARVYDNLNGHTTFSGFLLFPM